MQCRWHNTPCRRKPCRSFYKDPFTFARTNILGTLSLLQAAKRYWESLPEKYEGKRFYHISTDEVYGALEMTNPEGIDSPFATAASSAMHHRALWQGLFLKLPSIIHTVPIRHQRHRATTSCVRSTTYGLPTIVTLIALTTTGHIGSREIDTVVHQQYMQPPPTASLRQG